MLSTEEYREIVEALPEVDRFYGIYQNKYNGSYAIKYKDLQGKTKHRGLLSLLKEAHAIDPNVSVQPFKITCKTCQVEVQTDIANRQYCKVCSAGRRKINTRNSLLKRNYDLTPEQHAAMIAEQGGGCKICGKSSTRLVVDHDHDTGEVRGILCVRCNSCLGWYETHGNTAIQKYLQ